MTDALSQKVQNLEGKIEDWLSEQKEFNKSVTKTLHSIGNSINKMEVFQAEINHMSKKIDGIEIKADKDREKIEAIQNTQNINQEVIKEYRWLKRGLAAMFITALLGGGYTAVKEDPNKAILEKLVQIVEKTSKGN